MTSRRHTVIGFVKHHPCIFSLVPYYLRSALVRKEFCVGDHPESFTKTIAEKYRNETVKWKYFIDLTDQEKRLVRNQRLHAIRDVGKPQFLVVGFVRQEPVFLEYRNGRSLLQIDRFMRLEDWFDPAAYGVSAKYPDDFVYWACYDQLPDFIQRTVAQRFNL